MSRASRSGSSIAMLMIDTDNFKLVNDLYGHLAGDRALVAVAACLRNELRGHDGVGRFGGEELIVMLDVPDAKAAIEIAARLCAAISELSIDEGNVRVTASIGLANHDWDPNDLSVEELIDVLLQHADAALYRAEQAGRDPGARSSGNSRPRNSVTTIRANTVR